ncbi:unnamed protein product [Adineta steineri]|uniref:FYVE-type domain-containing protein n=1 Tax=Adineta steineri TaxID=433720 RepID=A0A815MJS3_9BILA|nr:unnamed protein product [Adineta steineri]CAF1620230.1 unnamed protein product [Adineta steineri]
MDFDIDAVLDQLEKTLNQSNFEEKETNQTIETLPSESLPFHNTSRRSADELLLLDLDPLGNTENHVDQENDDKLDRFKQDLEELYATSTVIDSSTILPPTPTLPDIIGQQEELSSTSLPLAVEQLENEVREEILHHTLESPLLLPDLTTLTNSNLDNKNETILLSRSLSSNEEDTEEQSTAESIIETTPVSNNLLFQNEPDLIQRETPTTVLHSVDSIVNASVVHDVKDFVVPNPPKIDLESLQISSELVFTSCNDNDEEPVQSISEEFIANSPIPSPSAITTTTTNAPIQDFDLVKNILSEIFDKPDEEILDESLIEEKEPEMINIEQQDILAPPASLTTNDNEDFRFLDEMLASVDISDGDIHQLTPAEIDRVDNLLKQIIDSQQTDDIPTSTSNEIESCPPPSSLSPPPTSERPPSPELVAGAASSSVPIDEELIRVEQEWAKLTEEEKHLGSVAPQWVSDDLAPVCMKCASKFSITRRRHHCRACGKVYCSTCCWQKVKLIHDDSKEDRACNDCVKTINEVEYLWTYMRNNQKPRTSVLRKRTGKHVFLR